MPYIPPKDRPRFQKVLFDIEALIQEGVTAGDLNYLFTKILHSFVFFKKKKYLTICIVMGTLICVAFEFYRRIAAPYEDEKIKENGDV